MRRAGFDLTHPYIEQCWGAVVGPSAVAIMRRRAVLWREQEPARIPVDALARSLGLGGGTGLQSRFQRALDRTVRFGLAQWEQPGRTLAVYTEVPPLHGARLDRLPEWSRRAHDRLLGHHVDQLLGATNSTSGVSNIAARLDRLQRPSEPAHAAVPGLGR